RVAHGKEIDALVEAWTEKRTKQETMEVLGKAGVPCGAVLDSAELLSDPQLVGGGMIVNIQHPTLGTIAMPGNPVRMSAHATEVPPAPLLGEPNAEVYGRFGLTTDDLVTLKREGVI